MTTCLLTSELTSEGEGRRGPMIFYWFTEYPYWFTEFCNSRKSACFDQLYGKSACFVHGKSPSVQGNPIVLIRFGIAPSGLERGKVYGLATCAALFRTRSFPL